MRRKWIGIVAVGLAVVVTAVVGLGVAGLLPSFGTDTVDRSQPAVLQAVRDLSEYHAAAGDYQVVVDIEKDVRYVPAEIAGERTLFVAAGSIDAFIDFRGLAGDAITVNQEQKTVQVKLPAPQLSKPNLDNSRSYVYRQDRGLFDQLGDLVSAPTDQREFYMAAEKRIAEAAQRSNLAERAQKNTVAMLNGLFTSLGYRMVQPPAQGG
ncbi:DUF4230 domain-containing protein [Actinokineospora auranticolor]|uniref:Uncharacterized protein DUF4230 n=1 Tax=Actinokineospora auranticolor TaxID=155976 RepID=A0A2S6GDP1_9PSEU|nr:DUF4230 domain-containing protein [Actinokineospora auranticolor]PPK63251.1 uncharacterized protein DUF4230 [Actinokineospora auranticolor]